MKRRKQKAKRKLKGNPEQQLSSAAEQVLTHVEREEPAKVVEAQAETQNLATIAETQLQAENSVAPVVPRDEIEDSANITVHQRSETEKLAETEAIYAEISSSVAPVEPGDAIEDAASTVELRGEAEELESILDIQVEVEDSSSAAEIRQASSIPPATSDTHGSTEIPASPVAISKEKPAPPSAPPAAPRTSADRRAHPRYAFTAAIETVASDLGARIKSQVRDLSQQGCFVDTETPLALGTATEVRITKGATNFEARARVVYNQTAKGMGLMFIAVDPQHLRTLDIWIAESRESSWRAANRRRSQRVLMKVPVQVAGQAADGATFEESTHTLSISPHGALLVLAAPVRRGQRFILSNTQTKSALECVVAHLEPTPGAPTQVGVEFSLPNPAFWRVAFPPKDWTPRHPDAKSR
jgi:hypothetical protein